MNAIHSSSPRALVVGAGVAGLTAAATLRAGGWTVEVVEHAGELRTGGYKVDVRGAGVEVLRRLGVLAAAREHACHVATGSIVTADGRTVAAMGGDTFGGRVGDDVEIERGDLIRLLADVAGPIRFGITPTELRQDGREVDVTFSDGTHRSFDVVLGADGLHSTVRRIAIAGAGAEPSVHDLGHAIAVATMPSAMGLTAEEVTYVAPGATVLMYATRTQPRARAMFLFTHDGPLPRERAEQIAFLRDRFADQGGRIPEILAHVDEADDVYLDSISQVHLPTWTSGRVGLIGDAAACASPASGQGTTIGLVSAYATAAALVADPTRVDAALRAAATQLRPFVERNQRLGPANLKRMVLPTARAVRSTLTGLRIMNALPFTDRLLGVVARKLARASAFELPAPGRAPGGAAGDARVD